MRNGRIIRSLAVMASAGLVMGAFFAVPAEAKKKKPKGCAAYAPGEAGAEAPVTQVTSANTADAPASLEVELGAGVGAGRNPEPPPNGEGQFVSHAFANLQVDSASASDVLNVRITWTEIPYDYDVYLDTADGTEVASSAGYGPIAGGSDYASSDLGSETIVAYPVSDCEGFTVDVVGATTPGGTVTVDYWLGE